MLYLSEQDLNIKNIIKRIKEILPDIIYLNSVFLYKFLFASLLYSKQNNTKIILAPRGELCNNALKIKNKKKKAYIYILRLLQISNKIFWHATSQEELDGIIKNLKVNKQNIYLVEVLPKRIDTQLTTINKKVNELKCVFISRICEKKNLLSAIKYVKQANNGVSLDIYGFKEDRNYWEKCEKEINNNSKIKYCGALEQEQVITTFAKYQLFLFPTYSENYGHVIAEAMLVGCPVLISDQTPWNDVEDKNAGYVKKLGDTNGFINTLNKISQMSNEEYQTLKINCSKYINEKINYQNIITNYKKMFEI